MVWLPDGEKCLKMRLFVSTKYTNVTNSKTNGRTDTADDIGRAAKPFLICIMSQRNDVFTLNPFFFFSCA